MQNLRFDVHCATERLLRRQITLLLPIGGALYAERRSFTQAADDLGLPRSSVTDAVKGLEARLGVRLLRRTTRQAR